MKYILRVLHLQNIYHQNLCIFLLLFHTQLYLNFEFEDYYNLCNQYRYLLISWYASRHTNTIVPRNKRQFRQLHHFCWGLGSIEDIHKNRQPYANNNAEEWSSLGNNPNERVIHCFGTSLGRFSWPSCVKKNRCRWPLSGEAYLLSLWFQTDRTWPNRCSDHSHPYILQSFLWQK